MADYTVQDLSRVENQGVRFGFDEQDFEIRMARVPLNCEDCGVTYIRVAPGWRHAAGHHHKRQEEIYVVVSGSARAKVGDDVIDLPRLHAVRVPPETMRAFEGGPEGAEIIAIGAPNTGPGDAVTTEDWWRD